MRDTRGAQGCALMLLSAAIVIVFVALAVRVLMEAM